MFLNPGFADDCTHIQCPVAFVKATGKHMGATEEEVRTMRANLDPLLAAHPNVTVFATVPSNHSQVVAKHPDTIASAIDAVAGKAAHNAPESSVPR